MKRIAQYAHSRLKVQNRALNNQSHYTQMTCPRFSTVTTSSLPQGVVPR